MEIGINLNCFYDLPLARQIELMQKNGFTRAFILADAPNFEEAVSACRTAGIRIENLHSPFRGVNALWENSENGERYFELQMKAIDACAKNGIPTLVEHLSSKLPPPLVSPIGILRIETLCKHAEENGVVLAFENQRSLGNLATVLERFPTAKFCWDVGHEHCFTDNIDFMAIFSGRIAAVHTHDNHAVFDGDEHLIPFDGVIDYDLVAQKLAKANYQGALMLELATSESNAYQNTSPEEYYARAGAAARKIANLVEGYRK